MLSRVIASCAILVERAKMLKPVPCATTANGRARKENAVSDYAFRRRNIKKDAVHLLHPLRTIQHNVCKAETQGFRNRRHLANSRTGTHIQSITAVIYHNMLCLSTENICMLCRRQRRPCYINYYLHFFGCAVGQWHDALTLLCAFTGLRTSH